MALVFDQAVTVLSKPSSERTQQECCLLFPWFRQLNPVLERMDKGTLLAILHHCTYSRSESDELLIWPGKEGQHLYFILKGSVSLYTDGILSTDGFLGQIHNGKSVEIPKPTKVSESKKVENENRQEQRNGLSFGKARLNRGKLGKYITSLGSGQSICDYIKIQDDGTKSFIVICDEPTHLLVVRHEHISTDLQDAIAAEELQMRQTVENHPFFQAIPLRMQRLLFTCMRIERFAFDSLIVRQGLPVNEIYFIRSGQAKVVIETKRHQNQYPHLWPFEAEIDLYSKEFKWLTKSRRASIVRKYVDSAVIPTKVDHVAVRRKEGYAGVEKMLKDRFVNLCSVQPGEVVADVELAFGLSTYLQSIRALHDVSVYVLPVSAAERICVRKFDLDRNETLIHFLVQKLENRMSSAMGQKVPLLKYLYARVNDSLEKIRQGLKERSKIKEKQKISKMKLPPWKVTNKPYSDKEDTIKQILERFDSERNALSNTIVPSDNFLIAVSHDRRKTNQNMRRGENSNIIPRTRKKRTKWWVTRSVKDVRKAVCLKLDYDKVNGLTQDFRQGRKTVRRDNNPVSIPFPNHNQLLPKMIQTNVVSDLPQTYPNITIEHSAKESENQHTLPEVFIKDETARLNGQHKEKRGMNLSVQDNEILYNQNIDQGIITDISKTRPSQLILSPVPEELDDSLQQHAPFITSCPENEQQHDITKISRSRELWQQLKYAIFNSYQWRQDTDYSQYTDESDSESGSSIRGGNYECSHQSLCNLEERLRRFHEDNLDRHYKYTLRLPSLKRYNNQQFEVPEDQEQYEVPRPGGKVWIQKRKCPYQDCFVRVKNHEHVRYHIVDTLPPLVSVPRI